MTENVEYIGASARLDDLINRLIRVKTRLLQSLSEVDGVQLQEGQPENLGTEQLNDELDVFSNELKKIEAGLSLLSMQANRT